MLSQLKNHICTAGSYQVVPVYDPNNMKTVQNKIPHFVSSLISNGLLLLECNYNTESSFIFVQLMWYMNICSSDFSSYLSKHSQAPYSPSVSEWPSLQLTELAGLVLMMFEQPLARVGVWAPVYWAVGVDLDLRLLGRNGLCRPLTGGLQG